VHEGGANGGHYYSFIYDNKNQKWRKFNDSIITDVTEEEVYKYSIGGEKSSCAYCLFYCQEGCEVIDFKTQNLEQLKALLSQDLLNFAETENTKFLTEYQHYNSNMVQTINDDYLMKMNSICFEAAKFQNELKSKPFPSVPSLSTFNSFLLLESQKCSDIARWNTLKTILKDKKVPYSILDGETTNYYYKELKELIVHSSSVYSLKSLELNEKQKQLLDSKQKEYLTLSKCMLILQAIFELIMDKKWKEALLTITVLHETVNQVKMQEYSNQFYSFASYLLALVALKYCSLMDMYQNKCDIKEGLKLLEILIYCLNRRQTIKPPPIFYSQIITNLYHTVNGNIKKNMKESDVAVFIHHIQKIEEKCEFLPSFDISKLIPKELTSALENLENQKSIFYQLESKSQSKVSDLYQQICKDRMKVWVDFEQLIRKKNSLIDQEFRLEKEMPTWSQDI